MAALPSAIRGLDHRCDAKTWGTAPPLTTVVLIGSMVSREFEFENTTGTWGRRGWRGSLVSPFDDLEGAAPSRLLAAAANAEAA